ncbi:8332_t:CDS:2 [Funneliformis geosporum]|uniref:5359_t:CDS:1 n=1 Tax=Funneliformis geosporum TaxID=1117311 RepID=A0A9W4WMR7_9GLOM|nr:8332_t:CDS:2 [Funneliformis geosporum]CAI2173010.1 5359_t:CDS:2 [Funneliformis geosporum]
MTKKKSSEAKSQSSASLYQSESQSTTEVTTSGYNKNRNGTQSSPNFGNPELNIQKFSLSTARIDLHGGKSEEEAKRLVITKIKNSPCVENASIFFIPGKGKNNSGTLYNRFPEWIEDKLIKNLIDDQRANGIGTYEVFIKKNGEKIYKDIPNDTLKIWRDNANQEDYKMALASICMKDKYFEAAKYYREVKSVEAKLCLGYLHSIGKLNYNTFEAEKLFKEVASEFEANKEAARIAKRNIAVIYHNQFIEKKLEANNEKLLEVLTKAKDMYKESFYLGDGQSAYNLGLLYENNYGIEEDKNEALKWFNEGANLGNLYAKAKFGLLLVDNNNKEDGDENEKRRGIGMLKDTAEKGLVMGQTFLGVIFESEQIYEKAVRYYSDAARKNFGFYSHVAQYRLKELNADDHIPDGENIEDILEIYEAELKYIYNDDEEELKIKFLSNY